MIDLENGYVIVQTSANNFSLKQKYMGMRKGVETECLRLISHHGSVEDAIISVSGLLQGCSGNEQRETLDQFVNRIESANTRLAESVSNSMAGSLYTYEQTEEPEILPIVSLIPVGRINCISRSDLVQKCVEIGLISPEIVDKDRRMRDLVGVARKAGNTIIKLSNGNGYYRLNNKYKASPIEQKELDHYIAENDKKAFSILKNTSPAKKLREDYMVGRI